MKKKINTIPTMTIAFILMMHSLIAQWNLTGNTGTNPSVNFIGTLDAKNFKIRTNNQVRLIVNSTGKVAIGNATPLWKLDVRGGSINTDSLYRINGIAVLSVTDPANTFVGYEAGLNNTGFKNTYVGYKAGTVCTSGSVNIALGPLAAFQISSGSENVFIGHAAGYSITTQNQNVMIGSNSGTFNTGINNTFCGYYSGWIAGSGTNNSFFGDSSGYQTTSNQNSFYGHRSGVKNTAGAANTFVGSDAGSANSTGSTNVFVGINAGLSNTNGFNNTYIGASAGGLPDINNATAIGAGSQVTASNCVVIGTVLTFTGIGTTAPAHMLELAANDAAKPGSNLWTVTSDRRLKTKISDYTDGLEMIRKIHPVWFEYNGLAGMPTGKQFTGIIAQEMQRVAPYTIGTWHYRDKEGNKTDYLEYDGNAVTYMLINSVKQLADENELLKNELAVLKKEVSEIKTRNTGNPVFFNELRQNIPNPFRNSTSVTYSIVQKFSSAEIVFYATDGKILKSVPVRQSKGSVEINAGDFSAGEYLYEMIVDGNKISTHKMMVME